MIGKYVWLCVCYILRGARNLIYVKHIHINAKQKTNASNHSVHAVMWMFAKQQFGNVLPYPVYSCSCLCSLASQVVLVVKNPPVNTGNIRDTGSIPGSGRSPGGGHGNPLQYSCLENPMDRGAWQAAVHRITQSQTQLKRLSTYTSMQLATIFCSIVYTYNSHYQLYNWYINYTIYV